MAIQLLNLGIKNDPATGDSLYDGGTKINENFTEVYNSLGSFITDAPSDGSEYARKDGAWSVIVIPDADIKILNWNYSLDNTEYLMTMNSNRYFHNYTPSIGVGEPWFRNLFIGEDAGNFSMSAIAGEAVATIGIGASSLASITTGHENVGIGTETLSLTTTGEMNTAIGSASLYSNISGIRNTAVGRQAGVWLSSGSNNTFLGSTAGFAKVGGGSLTTINQATLIGSWADGTEGSTNEIAIGYQVNGSGSNTVTLGNDSIIDTFLKGMVTLNGRLELPNATVTDAIISVGGVGFMHNSGQTQSFYQNTFLGYGAGSFTGTVDNPQNVGIGAYALNGLTTGIQNVALGWGALTYNQSGSQNMAIGDGSLYALISGNNNVAIGKNSLQSINGASGNIAIGRNSGIYAGAGSGTPLSLGSNHIMIGYLSRPSANGTSNEIVIGYGALGNGSNTVTLGEDTILNTYLKGIVTLNSNKGLKYDGRPLLHSYSGNTANAGNPWYRNLFIGEDAGNYTIGDGETVNGKGMLNVGIGSAALQSLTTGQQNNIIGVEGGALMTDCSGNNAIGDGILYYSITGVNYNTGMGKNVMQNLTTGIENIVIGHNSGFYVGSGTTKFTTGSNHILLGFQARASANSTVEEIVLGKNALGNGSNTATIGNSSNTAVYLKGKANISNVPTYADDAAAGVGGLIAGDIYATVTGEVRVKL